MTDAQACVAQMVDSKKAAVAQASLQEWSRWQDELRALANHIEDLQSRARRLVADELEVDELDL